MNPLIVETALQGALTASAFAGQTIYTGTSYAEITPESLNIIVSCDNLEHTCGPLYKAHVTIKLEAPALLGADQLTAITAALETLRNTVLNNTYLGANWPSGSAATYSGIWVQETAMSQHEHEWVAEVKVIVGIQE
jgi:hypothetical protein